MPCSYITKTKNTLSAKLQILYELFQLMVMVNCICLNVKSHITSIVNNSATLHVNKTVYASYITNV